MNSTALLLNKLGELPAQVWGISAIVSAIGVTALLTVLIIWTLVWKGLALWKAARNGAKVWFVVLLLVNTVGILDIIYYFFVSKKKWGKK